MPSIILYINELQHFEFYQSQYTLYSCLFAHWYRSDLTDMCMHDLINMWNDWKTKKKPPPQAKLKRVTCNKLLLLHKFYVNVLTALFMGNISNAAFPWLGKKKLDLEP